MSESSSSESTGSSPELDLVGWPANSGMGSREFNDMSSVLELDVGSAAPKSELKEGAGWLGVGAAEITHTGGFRFEMVGLGRKDVHGNATTMDWRPDNELMEVPNHDLCTDPCIDLSENQIGDVGLTALADACAKGALANLEELHLPVNRFGDAGLTALADACAKGALAQVTDLRLLNNNIGDAGLAALADACANGALAQLQSLYIGNNPASQQSKDALKTTLGKTQCTVDF